MAVGRSSRARRQLHRRLGARTIFPLVDRSNLLLAKVHASRQRPVQRPPGTITATLALGDTISPLFGPMTDAQIAVNVLGYVPHANAFIVEDQASLVGELYLVPLACLSHKPLDPKVPVLDDDPDNQAGTFKFAVGQHRPFYFDDWVFDGDGKPLVGQLTSCTILHRIRSKVTGENWCVVHLPEFHNPRDRDYNWWCAYDVRRESRLE